MRSSQLEKQRVLADWLSDNLRVELKRPYRTAIGCKKNEKGGCLRTVRMAAALYFTRKTTYSFKLPVLPSASKRLTSSAESATAANSRSISGSSKWWQ